MASYTGTPSLKGAQLGRLVTAVAASALLGGCSTVDQFGPRSARFNGEAVDGRSRSILANVMRSAYGKPLQFTDLTTITGQATLGGELGLAVPFDVDPNATARTYTGSPKVSASGTSTFNIANLNSREFYNGLQTPVSVQNIANLLASSYDPQLVLFLTISDIEIRTGQKRIRFHSTASSPKTFRLFYQAIQFMREAGLSTRAGKSSVVGPSYSADDLRSPPVMAAMLSGATGPLSIKPDPDKPDRFRLFRSSAYEFCFDPMLVKKTRFQVARSSAIAGEENLRTMNGFSNVPVPAALVIEGGVAVAGTSFQIEPGSFCEPPAGAERTTGTDIRITTRSVEGIFQFLGEIARQQLKMDGTSRDGLGVVDPTGRGLFPFRVVEGVPSNAALTILSDGKRYSVITDPSGSADQSTRVMQILTVLLAIQSSAKDLPAPSVISILTP